jgi:hypothetical protein
MDLVYAADLFRWPYTFDQALDVARDNLWTVYGSGGVVCISGTVNPARPLIIVS